MQNLSDQELDDLFKKASEKSEGDTVMPDWSDMNNRLNEADRTGIFGRTKKIITGSVLIITVAVSVWWAIEATSTHPREVRETRTKGYEEIDESAGIAHEEVNNSAVLESNAINNEPGSTSVSLSKIQPGIASTNNNKGIGGRINNIDGANIKSTHERNVRTPRNDASVKERSGTDEVIHSDIKEVSAKGLSNEGGESIDSVDAKKCEPETILRNDHVEGVDQADVSEDRVERKFYQRISFRFAISPDYSTVKSNKPDKIGLNYGVLVEYDLTKKLTVASGLIRSNKFYMASDMEYYGQTSDKVEGDCRMWDIPIMLYYNFSPQRSWSFFAGLGVSSYLMSEEKYVYHIEGSYGNTYTYYQTVNGQNKEWFSTLNLSVGLSKQLNTHWSIQLEPFYKAPLAGVGEGDVSLASFGAFFNVRYRIRK